MQYLICRIFNWVYKIPFSSAAYSELNREKKNLNYAKKDIFFKNYIPQYKFIGLLFKIRHMNHIDSDDSDILDDFFSKAFDNQNSWKNVSVSEIIDCELLKELLGHEKCFLELLDNLKKIKIPLSSAHGDFHAGNIFIHEKKLYIIDWPYFSKKSCRYFDLIHYHVTTQNGTGWINRIKLLLEKKKHSITLSGIEITQEILIGYCIWRFANALRVLEKYNFITATKIDKFKTLIEYIVSKI